MQSTNSNYNLLISKIDEFTRKFYLNKVLRGCIYFAAALFAGYLLITLAEYYGNFEPAFRTVLVLGFVCLVLFILLGWIIIPLSKYFKLGQTISYEQAAEIIGQHFAPVKDKLLNTLQLKKLADNNPGQQSLIIAGIDQKIAELKPVPFTSAVKLNENRKYIKYALVPFTVLLLLAFTAPAIFSESTTRLINYNKVFKKKAPFDFNVVNSSLSAMQGDDFKLQIKITGNEIPQDVYVEDGVNSFKLEKENITSFNYTFKNLQNSKKFRLSAGDFSSDEYTIAVKAKPALLSFDVLLQYPAYLRRASEKIANSGDLTVPAGTRIKWTLKTAAADQLLFGLGGNNTIIRPASDDLFIVNSLARQNTTYSLLPVNSSLKNNQAATYSLNVIPDLSPVIEVSEQQDSVNKKVHYFVGRLSDDHGFSRLNFVYRVINQNKQSKASVKQIPANLANPQSSFLYLWDLKDVNIAPGQKVEYFFEVYDNDGFNGPKVSRTPVMTLNIPTGREVEKSLDAGTQAVKNKMADAIKLASQLEKEAKKINQDLLDKKALSFDEKKQIEQLLQKQKDLQALVEDIKKDNKQNAFEKNENREQQQEILEKQKQIDELFNNVLDEKTREILKNIQKLLQLNDKNLTKDELSKMQTDNKSLQKELDRILELYKQLEFDQKLSENIDKLKELAKKQQELSNKTADKNSNAELAKQEQNKLNQEFKDIKESLRDLEKKNEELEQQNNFASPKSEEQEIEREQSQSSKNLDNKNTKQAAQNQQNAARKMEEMSEKLSAMQEANEEQENNVNVQELRQILDNLVKTSFDQESVMQSLKTTAYNDPSYLILTQKQKGIQDNMKMIRDSLYSLSRRVPQIESTVNKEITAINDNIDGALKLLSERSTNVSVRNQQYAMTSMNNLALLLNEALEQLQKAQQNAKGGKGKPKQSLSQLSKMQEQLNKNMEKARQQMQQQGNKPEGQQPGKQGKDGQMSQQLSKMAKEQQMIRQALQEINRESNKDGKGGLGNLDQLMKDMEQTETDLVNKRIQQETIKRQQEILTKLLDSEKAEREREQDKKRESKTAQERAPNYNLMLQQYQKVKESETELIRTIPPALNSFYKLKVGDYFKLLNSGTQND